MEKNIIFNICAIPIYLIILFSTYIRKSTKGTTNRWLISMVYISFATVLVDLIADGYKSWLPLNDLQLVLVTVTNYLYFALRNSIAILYLFFLFSITRGNFKKLKLGTRIFILLPYTLLLILLISNIFHEQVFSVTKEAGYTRGPLLSVFYAISILYSVLGIIYLIYCYNLLQIGKWIALISMYILSFIGISIQFYASNILVELFATSIAFLLIILLVLRPEEITDINVGIPSWKAYRNELYKITQMKNPVIINIVRYTNATIVRDYLGEERFYEYISKIADIMEDLRKKNKISIDTYYEAPGTFYFILGENSINYDATVDFNKITEQIKAATKLQDLGGIYLSPILCSIKYPDDLKTVDEIIRLGHSFHLLMGEHKKVIYARELIGTSNYEIETNISTILKEALDNNLFEMFYQPIYNLHTKKYTSAEALIRLHNTDYGLISPATFIPAAEKNGLIIAIGNYVLDAVFNFVGRTDIKALGLDYIEINLSVAQCFQQDLVENVVNLQKKYNVNPEQINFEITETTYNDIGTVATHNITELVKMGYSFSLDDYGTGFSNIQRIVKLPLSLIKIDKSLVDEININDGKSLIRNTISMMKDINKKVLAEGVEEKDQLSLLQEMECDYIQGYFFSIPLPENEFVSFLKNQLCR